MAAPVAEAERKNNSQKELDRKPDRIAGGGIGERRFGFGHRLVSTADQDKRLVFEVRPEEKHTSKNDTANESAGARTLDLRIKSPLLYQLSYALGRGNSSHRDRSRVGIIKERQPGDQSP